jgi:hypothetical protein
VVVPYVFIGGAGRRSAEAIWHILGGWPESVGDEGLLGYTNTVDLKCIPIKPDPPGSFDVDSELLVAEVAKTFARIGAKETKAIAEYVAGLKEAKEE